MRGKSVNRAKWRPQKGYNDVEKVDGWERVRKGEDSGVGKVSWM